jgi:hypothetical protein
MSEYHPENDGGGPGKPFSYLLGVVYRGGRAWSPAFHQRTGALRQKLEGPGCHRGAKN